MVNRLLQASPQHYPNVPTVAIQAVYYEEGELADYQVTITSPLGLEYWFYVDYMEPLASLYNEAVSFNAKDYYECLKRRRDKNPSMDFTDEELFEDAVWLKMFLVRYYDESCR